jgi:hypothetical protein
MSKYSYRETFRLALAVLALSLAHSGSLLAQERSTGTVPRESDQLAQAQPVEIAAAAELPSAPSALIGTEAGASGAALITPAPAPFVSQTQPVGRPETHAFWDRENRLLFVGVGAAATADFFTTRANLAHGGKELNPVARLLSGSTPGLATNFALETGGIMAVSYLFHKTGHHTLERLTSVVNIGASGYAVAYGQTHR